MDDIFARLEAEFCPPIDPALFSAIVSDYDLDNERSLEEARATLDLLKATAVAEEATGFDPSGSSAQDDGCGPESAVSAPATDADTNTTSRDTESSSLSNGMSSLDLTDDPSISAANEDVKGIEKMDSDSKARLLHDLVPTLNDFTIAHALKKHQNGFWQTLDVLLNQVYLSENQAAEAKGIEAFSEESNALRGRKKKKGKRVRLEDDDRRASSLPTHHGDPAPATNKWQTAAKDIDFIASHLNMPREKVASIYNRENGSKRRTIASILESWLDNNQLLATEDLSIQVDAFELGNDFPTLSERHRIALIGLTQPSTAGAHELAEALATTEASQDSISLRVLPQYAPLNLANDDEDDTIRYAITAQSARSSLDFQGASSRAVTLNIAREEAINKARAAFRKSKSDRYMGGAAAYYSQVSRDLKNSSQVYSAAAADSLVNSQSSATHIDLHGVTVDDAKRITRTKVNQWWDRLGENKYNGRVGANDRAAGFRIVTGAGKHSRGGRGVLGPAVKKVLEQDGWRIESTSGEILVKGKIR